MRTTDALSRPERLEAMLNKDGMVWKSFSAETFKTGELSVVFEKSRYHTVASADVVGIGITQSARSRHGAGVLWVTIIYAATG